MERRPWSSALTVNGDRLSSAARSYHARLVDVLREDYHLNRASSRCVAKAFCGACMVLVDGFAYSVVLDAGGKLAEDCKIRTVEGLAVDGTLTPIQAALETCDAVQCGLCAFPAWWSP